MNRSLLLSITFVLKQAFSDIYRLIFKSLGGILGFFLALFYVYIFSTTKLLMFIKSVIMGGRIVFNDPARIGKIFEKGL